MPYWITKNYKAYKYVLPVMEFYSIMNLRRGTFLLLEKLQWRRIYKGKTRLFVFRISIPAKLKRKDYVKRVAYLITE
jgi:hypothetical protein